MLLTASDLVFPESMKTENPVCISCFTQQRESKRCAAQQQAIYAEYP